MFNSHIMEILTPTLIQGRIPQDILGFLALHSPMMIDGDCDQKKNLNLCNRAVQTLVVVVKENSYTKEIVKENNEAVTKTIVILLFSFLVITITMLLPSW